MLITIENILTAEELTTARELLKQATWGTGLATVGPQAAKVKNNQQLPEDSAQLPVLRRLVLTALNRNVLFFTAALPLKILPPFFNRYQGTTNQYGFHTDNAMRLAPGGQGSYVRADLSATLFLTDANDYDGGELTIADTFGNHSIKLNAGSLVLYPSSSVHAVTPVTRGTRMACFMFIQSMVRDTEQRRLLFETDMALLELRSSVGETPAVVKLTSTYHNLLRMWAST